MNNAKRSARLVQRAIEGLEKKRCQITVQNIMTECNALGYPRPSAPTVRARLREMGFEFVAGDKFTEIEWKRKRSESRA